MGIWNDMIDVICSALRFVRNVIHTIVQGVLRFVDYVLNWFKSLRLDPHTQTPFIADGNKIKDMIKSAPRKNVGIFEGVYDDEEDEITEHRYLDANSMDEKTKKTLGNEPLVVLS